MGSLKTLALAGSLALGVSAAAKAADLAYAPPPPPPEPLGLKGTISSGIYLRGDIGVGVQSVGKYQQDDVAQFGGSFFGKTDNAAFFGGIGVGYRFNNWLRFDVTGEYRGAGQIGVSDIVFNPFNNGNQTNTYKGNLTSLVTLFNGYFDLGTWNCLTPYLGAGIGFANHSVNGLTDNGINQAVGSPFANVSYAYGDTGSKTNFAWALMAGVAYDVTSSLKLDIGYRYLNMGDGPTIGLAGANGLLVNPSSSVRFKQIDSHDIRIGMRWNFNDPNCCGPKEQPVYAPAPHVVRKF